MEHHIGHSYEVAEGRTACDCSCGYFAMSKNEHEVEELMNDHMKPHVTVNMKTSLGFLQAQGFDTSEFVERWAEPQRSYHDLHHINDMLASFYDIERYRSTAKYGAPFTELERTILHLSGWYHDIIYAPGDKMNEQLSANLAYDEISKVSIGIAKMVYESVLATQSHTSMQGNILIGYLIDADLKSLGVPTAAYMRNSDRVKAEYPGITQEQWFAGRRAFLESFLARDKIYFTSWGTQFENQARTNMKLELGFIIKQQIDATLR